MQSLQSREIGDGDYDLLLQIEEKQRVVEAQELQGIDLALDLSQWLTQAYMINCKTAVPRSVRSGTTCSKCKEAMSVPIQMDELSEADMLQRAMGGGLDEIKKVIHLPCRHYIHKQCLEEEFLKEKNNKCPMCAGVVL